MKIYWLNIKVIFLKTGKVRPTCATACQSPKRMFLLATTKTRESGKTSVSKISWTALSTGRPIDRHGLDFYKAIEICKTFIKAYWFDSLTLFWYLTGLKLLFKTVNESSWPLRTTNFTLANPVTETKFIADSHFSSHQHCLYSWTSGFHHRQARDATFEDQVAASPLHVYLRKFDHYHIDQCDSALWRKVSRIG